MKVFAWLRAAFAVVVVRRSLTSRERADGTGLKAAGPGSPTAAIGGNRAGRRSAGEPRTAFGRMSAAVAGWTGRRSGSRASRLRGCCARGSLRGTFLRRCATGALAASAWLGIGAAAPNNASVSAALSPAGGRISVEATATPAPVPLFFTAAVEQTIEVSTDAILGKSVVALHVLQGRPEVLTLELGGGGEITAVTGAGLRDWAVRQGVGTAAGRRFLDLRPALPIDQDGPRDLIVTVSSRHDNLVLPADVDLLLLSPGDASAFRWHGTIEPDPSVDLRLMHLGGVTHIHQDGADNRRLEFVNRGDPVIALHVMRRGSAAPEVEFLQLHAAGRLDDSARGMAFHVAGQVKAAHAGARVPILSGHAALSGATAGEGWHAELTTAENPPGYVLVFDRAGVVSIAFDFAAAIRRDDDSQQVDFHLGGGPVVPVTLSGFGRAVRFDPASSLLVTANGDAWDGYVPADGEATLRWKQTHENAEAALSFSSSEQTEIRVAAGLIRQVSALHLRVAQGKLQSLKLRVEGPGEIVGIEGTNLVGWQLEGAGNDRVVNLRFSRPVEGESTISIRAQSVLGNFPVRTEAMRFSPEGGVRHSGFVRIANAGAVRLDVTNLEGLLQLTPAQFPGAAIEAGARQVFVYRFPSATRRFTVLASQIVPEVNVSQVTTYALGAADRLIEAELELDIREAPLRDWTFDIPAGYAVAAVTGADVSDYTHAAAGADGRGALTVHFGRPVTGRELVQLRLEKNETAAAGEWRIPPLRFPGAKSVRGHIGIRSTLGFRVVPTVVGQLAELPLSVFPRQESGLQQAFRLRDPNWSAAMHVEALGQNIQADVFHLYSLKQGALSASVLINYFVVGAPVRECRIEVPVDAGNIDVLGQGVRRDWQREGNLLIVALHEPVLGALTLLVTFEEPLSARGGVIRPGEVKPLNVQAERGYVQVVSALQVQARMVKADGGVLKVEPLELPPELRLLTTAPSLAAYEYTARPFGLEMAVTAYPPAELVDQVIDFAKFTSQVARDGQVVTEARLFVKTRGRKVLRFQLPPGMRLWESRVDGELVTPRADADWIMVPLSGRLNPNDPVKVDLRLGQAARSPRSIRLVAPRLSMPLVIGEWDVRSDRERLLVPRSAQAELTAPNLTEAGFEWIGGRGRAGVVVLVALVAMAALLSRLKSALGAAGVLAGGGCAVALALMLACESTTLRRANRLEVSYAATVVPANGEVALELGNVPAWQAMLSAWGLVAAAAGIAAVTTAWRLRSRSRARTDALAAAGLIAVLGGVLAQRGGALPFFLLVALAVAWFALRPACRFVGALWRRWRRGDGPAEAAAASTVLPLLIGGMLAVGTLVRPPSARADTLLPEPAATTAQSIVQHWDIRAGRLYGDIDVVVRGAPEDSFVLLKSPAVLTAFSGDGLRITKVVRGDHTVYCVALDRPGPLTGHAKFELPVPDVAQGIPVLTGPAAVQRVSVQLDQAGWEFSSADAVQVTRAASSAAGRSGASLVLRTGDGPAKVTLSPQHRDAASEVTRYYAELANVFVPGPGVVNAYVRVTIRPVQGRVSEIAVHVPDGFAVGEVGHGPVGAWRFEPEKRELHVGIEPAQTDVFKFTIELQRAATALPFDAVLQPLRVAGAAGQFGSLALAFAGDAQPEQVRPAAMAAMSIDDFDRDVLPAGRNGQPLAVVHAAFRYSDPRGRVALRVAAIDPEIRVNSRQLVSLGDDRLVVAADLDVAITRVGIFQLSFVVPPGLDIDAVSGPALSHWTEATEKADHVVTLHLDGRTQGETNFAISLAGPSPSISQPWLVPQLRLREATRQTGDLQVVPERGLRLRALARRNASELDPRTLQDARPGALAFRLLDENAAVTLGIEALDPWITVQALEEVTVREGQTLTRLALHYHVENAAVKRLRVQLPRLTEEQAKTVHATGALVSDVVSIGPGVDLWELHLQHGLIGDTAVQLEYQGSSAGADGRLVIAPPRFDGIRQVEQYIAVRGGGRVDVDAPSPPRGWEHVDWSAVPSGLQDRADRSVPPLAFRAIEPEKPLDIAVARHGVADALKLRVTAAELSTVVSGRGETLTAVRLDIAVAEKSTLRVGLPPHAVLYNAFMNGESVSVVRDGESYLLHVMANTTSDPTARVRLVYSASDGGISDLSLCAPSLNVPLENVTWRVVIPPGYALEGYRGGLRLNEQRFGGGFELADYQASLVSRRAADARQATDFLQTASTLLQQGRQQQAGELLLRAARTSSLDEASNEDARVQLRALRTQQTVVGLNTRRQRLYLDNNGDVLRNEQLEQAANLNPVMRGKLDFDPGQLDQLLMGNSVEENAALRGIAARIVDQQLAAEPTTTAIDLTIPERGQVLTFGRTLQVNGEAPLKLRVTMAQQNQEYPLFALALLGALGVIAAFWLRGVAPASRATA